MPFIPIILNQIKYPTKEEIMDKPMLHKKEVIEIIKNWRKNYWREVKNSANNEAKFNAIIALLEAIAEFYNKPVNARYIPTAPSYSYNPRTKTIIINRSLSIISALHELAHCLFNANETKACRWSIWLFKKAFPMAFNKLIWREHMLVKPKHQI